MGVNSKYYKKNITEMKDKRKSAIIKICQGAKCTRLTKSEKWYIVVCIIKHTHHKLANMQYLSPERNGNMRFVVPPKLLFAATLLVICSSLVSSVYAQDADKEAKAKMLFDVAWNYGLSSEEAIIRLKQIETEYPAFSNMAWVKYRHAHGCMYLKKYDEAISVSRDMINSYPNTTMAAW